MDIGEVEREKQYGKVLGNKLFYFPHSTRFLKSRLHFLCFLGVERTKKLGFMMELLWRFVSLTLLDNFSCSARGKSIFEKLNKL
jgi:hypothetical protein